MPSALRAFVAEPSRENYLAAREELLAASSRSLTAAEMDSLSLLADAGDAKGKKDRRAIPPGYTMASKSPLTVDVKSDQHTYDLELFSHR